MVKQQTYTCNALLYKFSGSDAALIVLIIAYFLLAFFILVQMCRLCTKAFSYNKFHIHEAYRFYTIALVSSILISISRLTQYQLNTIIQQQQKQFSIYGTRVIPPPFPDYESKKQGWKILNQLMGLISINVTNIMYIVIGFTWLNIALGCDFVSKVQDRSEDDFGSIYQQPASVRFSSSAVQAQLSQKTLIRRRKQIVKKKVRILKAITLYGLFPFILLYCVYATLQRSSALCKSTSYMALLGTLLSLLLLGYSILRFLKNRIRDPQTSKQSKIALIYLLVMITIRQLWFSVIEFNGDQQYVNDVIMVIYSILVSVSPILTLAYLAQKQLSKQKFSLIKSEQVMLMQSTIL